MKGRSCCFGIVMGVMGLLALSVVLCGVLYFYMTTNQPEPPIPDFTPDVAAANRFENKVANAPEPDGSFTISITEAEASSWANLNADAVQESATPFENVQVQFRDGASTVYAEVDAFGFSNIGMQAGLSYTITPDGQVNVQVSSINFGGLGLPESFKAEMSQQIQTAVDQQLQEISGSYHVNNISSQDGVLSIQGQVTG